MGSIDEELVQLWNKPKGFQQSRNVKVLGDFIRYCREHPQQRFWQALRNWSGYDAVNVVTRHGWDASDIEDTFHWEGKKGGKWKDERSLENINAVR